MNIDCKTFEKLINEVRIYYSRLNKIEEALGGVILNGFYDLPITLCTEIEKATGVEWTDDIWEYINLPITDCSIEDIWEKIEKLKRENNGQ